MMINVGDFVTIGEQSEIIYVVKTTWTSQSELLEFCTTNGRRKINNKKPIWANNSLIKPVNEKKITNIKE